MLNREVRVGKRQRKGRRREDDAASGCGRGGTSRRKEGEARSVMKGIVEAFVGKDEENMKKKYRKPRRTSEEQLGGVLCCL